MPPVTAVVEVLPPDDSRGPHLWRRVGALHNGRRMGAGSSVDTTIETLVAAGEVAPDDPLIDEARQVAATLTGQPNAAVTTRQPWASVLAGGLRNDGPRGAVALGVLTDPVDGIVISLEGLVSRSRLLHRPCGGVTR